MNKERIYFKSHIPAIAVNLFVGCMSFISWLYMTLRMDNGILASSGWVSLRYFTVLSNLFNGLIALIYALWLIKGVRITTGKKTLKLTAVSAVGLTFITVMVFLGPLYGYGMMFEGANLWMHLILPVLSFISFIAFEREQRIPFYYTYFAGIPTFVYEVCYVGNIILNGKGSWPDTNDFYGFLSWGNAIGAVIACAVIFVTWLVAVILQLAGNAGQKK